MEQEKIVTTPVPTPSIPVPTPPQSLVVPKSNSKTWMLIASGVVILALAGLNIYTYQKLSQAKLDLKTAVSDNKKLTDENYMYKSVISSGDQGINDSLAVARDKSTNTKNKNNARNIDTALAQYYLDNGNKFPISSKRSGVSIEEISKALSQYISTGNVFQHDLQALYATSSDGKYFVQARCLIGVYDPPTTEFNGVYSVVNGSVTFPNEAAVSKGSTGKIISGLTCKQVFLTYGPQ